MELLEERFIEQLTAAIKRQVFVEVEASGRHAHLSREDVDALFGPGYQLTKVRDLSQPGQFVCKERITVTGPKGSLENVVILGPERPKSQVEVSMTDTRVLGITPVVRQSGEVQDTPGAALSMGDRQVTMREGVIVAKRHIHLTPEDAKRFSLEDGEIVKLKVFGKRELTFGDVVARVSPKFATYVHIDYDEANACGFIKGMLGIISK